VCGMYVRLAKFLKEHLNTRSVDITPSPEFRVRTCDRVDDLERSWSRVQYRVSYSCGSEVYFI
jgi:hypothetical protein